MNKFCRRSASVVFFAILAQSPVNAEINDGLDHSTVQTANNPAMGSNHPPVSGNHPGMGMTMGKGVMPANMPKMPEGPKKRGKVKELINGGGYSYLLIETDGQKFWVAGTQISTKVGDMVSYIENVSMSNFTSRTLKRTFDHIVFASTLAVID